MSTLADKTVFIFLLCLLAYSIFFATYVDFYSYDSIYGGYYIHLVALSTWLSILFFDSSLGHDFNRLFNFDSKIPSRVNCGSFCRRRAVVLLIVSAVAGVITWGSVVLWRRSYEVVSSEQKKSCSGNGERILAGTIFETGQCFCEKGYTGAYCQNSFRLPSGECPGDTYGEECDKYCVNADPIDWDIVNDDAWPVSCSGHGTCTNQGNCLCDDNYFTTAGSTSHLCTLTCPSLNGVKCGHGKCLQGKCSCDAGHVKNDVGLCIACDVGKFALANQDGECVNCQKGRFVGVTAQSSCGACPAGTISFVGKSSCSACAEGTYNEREERSECKTCPEGYVQGETPTSCDQLPCEIGQYRGGNVCNSCPQGFFTSDWASAALTLCETCPSGYSSMGDKPNICTCDGSRKSCKTSYCIWSGESF